MSSRLTVYKASAGSGKTFTLAVEYIAQLLATPSPSSFCHILAVTFTNKATAEMKDRILVQLYAIAHQLPEGKAYLKAVKDKLQDRAVVLSDHQLQDRAQKALSALLHDYTHFRVETIDSFFQSILRGLAHELGLTANLEVELNDTEVVNAAVDRIIDNLQYDSSMQNWILNYVTEQIEENKGWDVTKVIKNFAKMVFSESFQRRSEEQRRLLDDEKLIQTFRQQMRDLQNDEQDQVQAMIDEIDKELALGPVTVDVLCKGTNYTNALKSISELDYDITKKTLANAAADPTVMLKKADQKKPELMAHAKVLSGLFDQLLTKYAESAKIVFSCRLAAKHINPLRLLGSIEKKANEICKENNQFLLNRTPILLSKMVNNSDAPFVFEKIGTKLQHVMIDEFQDTSLMQWHNFKALLLENQAAGGSDLVVGDVKQSIYRWRNGDWRVLHGIGTEMSALNPHIVNLDTNYRSHSHIVSFNNQFFPKAAAVLDAINPNASLHIADIYADVVQKTKSEEEKGFVRMQLYARKGVSKPENYEERMLGDMIGQIRELMTLGVALEDMVVLVRNRKDGADLIRQFRTMAPDIQLVSDEAFAISSSVAVEMIVNALRVLADPSCDDPISRRFLAMHYKKDVLNQSFETSFYNTDALLQQLPDAFVAYQDELAQLPLYVLCETLYRIFSLHKIAGQEAYLFAFFDQLQAYLRNSPADIQSFLAAYDEQISNTHIACGQMPGLRIMTIHQSKGLQFHTVFLPYSDWKLDDLRNDDILWCAPKASPFDALGLLPIPANGKQVDQSIFAPMVKEERFQLRVDSINMLYVAFTRAEANLFLWGNTNGSMGKTPNVGDLLQSALVLEPEGDVYTYTLGTMAVVEQQKEKISTNRLAATPQYASPIYSSFPARIDFRQSNESARFIRDMAEEPTSKDYVEMGKVMHYVLSQIRAAADVDAVLESCLHKGLVADEEQQKTIAQYIAKGMQHSQIAAWFSPGVEIYNECNIVSLDPVTNTPIVRRPDRVVVTNEIIAVIDFKCGKPKPEYQTQVQDYMQLMHKMYPQRQIEGYLWYLYTGHVDQIFLPLQLI